MPERFTKKVQLFQGETVVGTLSDPEASPASQVGATVGRYMSN